MLPLLLTLALSQAPAPTPPMKLVSLGFKEARVARAVVDSFEATFAARLGQTGVLQVTTQADLAGLLGLERQRALLGCSEQTGSCMAELAGATGAEGVIMGDVALLGEVLQLSVRVLSSTDGRVLFQALERAQGEQEALVALDRIALQAARTLRPGAVLQLAPTGPTVAAGAAGPGVGPWVLVSAGAALAIGGAVAQGLAAGDYERLRTGAGVTGASAPELYASGTTRQAVGLSLLGAGGAALVGGLLWWALSPPRATSRPALSAAPWSNGGASGLVLAGQF